MAEAVITELAVTTRRVPLPRPWGPDVRQVHLIVLRLRDSDGGEGIGFSWTPQVGATAITALLETDVRDAVLGWPTDPGVVWDRLWRRLHEAGGGGIMTMAMAAVDIALWDLRGRASGSGLVDLIGRRHERVAVYGSGINRHYSLDQLVDQARRFRAAGYRGVKVKVGHDEVEADVERVAAVREAIGPHLPLMVDANQRWDLPTARRAVTALERFDLHWVEEPLLSDDLEAHAELRRHIATPIALGESLYTAYQFRDAIRRGACDVVQPNVVRVGGITPFLRIAELAKTGGVGLAPHLLIDISGQLAMTLPQRCWVEDVEDASFDALGVLAELSGVAVADGWLAADTPPGHGLRFTSTGD
ncbi:MAG: mandelate racemase/muconate lactonizing enzyme family protein [Actinophytocola sp.]|nr:mandelate racemase/muconate lactonizing enzyme family protein [Actinophytocola sp.]